MVKLYKKIKTEPKLFIDGGVCYIPKVKPPTEVPRLMAEVHQGKKKKLDYKICL